MRNKRVLIVGESHVRLYASRNNVLSFFMSSGKKFRLSNYEFSVRKIKKFMKTFPFEEGDVIMIQMGEPDLRLQLGYGLYPHFVVDKTVPPDANGHQRRNRLVEPKVDKTFIKGVVDNYVSISNLVKEVYNRDVWLISPSTSYTPSIPATRVFNNMMLDKQVQYIDLVSEIYENDEIKDSYRIGADQIHLGAGVAELLLNKMVESNIIDDIRLYKKNTEVVASGEMKSKFKFNERFNCWCSVVD